MQLDTLATLKYTRKWEKKTMTQRDIGRSEIVDILLSMLYLLKIQEILKLQLQ